MTSIASLALCAAVLLGAIRDGTGAERNATMTDTLVHWPAPKDEPASMEFSLRVDGTPVFVYPARVRTQIHQHPGLWTHKPDAPAEPASFAIFDLRGPAEIAVRPARPFQSATVLPESFDIRPVIRDGEVRFTLDTPHHVTVILDDNDHSPLHLFVSEPEADAPSPEDPNVVYFGPGLHTVDSIQPRDGQTVYLAGGAVVRAELPPGTKGTYNDKWKVTFYGGVVLPIRNVSNVTVRGRGILDGSRIPHPGRNLVLLQNATDIRLEGITLRDSPNWNVNMRSSRNVTVDNLRIVSGRLNSDGINSVNSRDVRVRRCFVRNHDDSIVAKAVEPEPPCENILVEDCQAWADWGFAYGATYETRAPIRNVTFRRCSILFAHHWCMGIRVSDAATVSDIRFEQMQVGRLVRPPAAGSAYAALSREPQLLSLSIVKDVWGKDPEPGHIRNVILDNVVLHTPGMIGSSLAGYDAMHRIEGVLFRNVRRAGHPDALGLADLRLNCNEHVSGIEAVH